MSRHVGKGQEISKNPWEQQIQAEVKVFNLEYVVGSSQFLRRAEPWKEGESKSMASVLHSKYIKKWTKFYQNLSKVS